MYASEVARSLGVGNWVLVASTSVSRTSAIEEKVGDWYKSITSCGPSGISCGEGVGSGDDMRGISLIEG